MGSGLLSSNGHEHRRQRKLLNPSFAPSHIRRMAPLMRDISSQLRDVVVEEVSQAQDAGSGKGSHVCELDIAEYLGRAAIEFIGQAGFGHTFRALEGGSDGYVHAVKDIVYVHRNRHYDQTYSLNVQCV